ncbi:ABC transporter permease [uncultured Oscillibacter sp.]|uniref:ABC transporter permease n=1 Tax=uncultured Oscillibacter sp. TaxID=876091 RepID=UPI0025D578F9|nr:ABC transporter permease [uncultured Oscillibacter sp.]
MKQSNGSAFGRSCMRSLLALRQPLIAAVFGLVVGAVVILACGQNPLLVYAEMFEKSFLKPYYLFSTLTRATPIIISAMATAMAWRAGYINIGVEGQMITGAFAATVFALYVPGPPVLICLLAWIVGLIAGALYALLPAVLTWKFNVSMVITTLMLNYVASYITSYFVTYPLKDTAGDGLALQTMELSEAMQLPRLSSTSTFNAGFIIAVIVMLAMLYLTRRTVFGYESKMGGFNAAFARYGGTKQVKVMMITMALSGAIAAIGGSTEVFGIKYRFIDGMFTSTSYAWTGLMAALMANLHPVGMFVASIFLSGLQIGGSAIQRSMGIPLEIATIIQCCITLFVSVKVVFQFTRKKKAKTAEGGAQA